MQFLILVLIFLLIITLVYFLMKRSKVVVKKDEPLDVFIKAIELYMDKNHPKININYKHIELPKEEKSLSIKQTLIVENIIEQFYEHEFLIKSQESIPKDKLWPSYTYNSQRNSYPNDWIKRKELAYMRDSRCCKRCGQELASLNEVYTSFVRPIKDGGGYNFENIIILCSDCNRILESDSQKASVINSLKLYDNLLKFIGG